MNKKEVVRLNGAEIGNLWTSYMSDSMAIAILKVFLNHAKDNKVRDVLEFALDLAQKHVDEITEIFRYENHPIPKGFTQKDINPNAPRLFSDTFYLIYLQNMARMGLGAYSIALPVMARSDVKKYYQECVASSADLTDKITNVMLDKGIYTRAPYISVPDETGFIQKQDYKDGIFGKHRPLTAQEMTNVFLTLLTGVFSKVLLSGYSQVAQSEEVRNYMLQGKKIADKHIEVLGSILHQSELSAPPTWDSEITESTISPLSDKIMMFHSRILSQAGILNYGTGISMAMRHDLIPTYTRLSAELGKYGDKGLNIMIENEWLEEPPRAADRDALAKKRKDQPK